MTNPKNDDRMGRVVQVIGPVVDVRFPPEGLPEINSAITIDDPAQQRVLTCEAAQGFASVLSQK